MEPMVDVESLAQLAGRATDAAAAAAAARIADLGAGLGATEPEAAVCDVEPSSAMIQETTTSDDDAQSDDAVEPSPAAIEDVQEMADGSNDVEAIVGEAVEAIICDAAALSSAAASSSAETQDVAQETVTANHDVAQETADVVAAIISEALEGVVSEAVASSSAATQDVAQETEALASSSGAIQEVARETATAEAAEDVASILSEAVEAIICDAAASSAIEEALQEVATAADVAAIVGEALEAIVSEAVESQERATSDHENNVEAIITEPISRVSSAAILKVAQETTDEDDDAEAEAFVGETIEAVVSEAAVASSAAAIQDVAQETATSDDADVTAMVREAVEAIVREAVESQERDTSDDYALYSAAAQLSDDANNVEALVSEPISRVSSAAMLNVAQEATGEDDDAEADAVVSEAIEPPIAIQDAPETTAGGDDARAGAVGEAAASSWAVLEDFAALEHLAQETAGDVDAIVSESLDGIVSDAIESSPAAVQDLQVTTGDDIDAIVFEAFDGIVSEAVESSAAVQDLQVTTGDDIDAIVFEAFDGIVSEAVESSAATQDLQVKTAGDGAMSRRATGTEALSKKDAAQAQAVAAYEAIDLSSAVTQEVAQARETDDACSDTIVAVVGFHHTRGNVVESLWPEDVFETSSADTLAFTALPDGAHHAKADDDWAYFSIPRGDATWHGVTCVVQIPVAALSEGLTASKERDAATRGTVQKAVCVVCSEPRYGELRDRLRAVAHGFRNQRDAFDVGMLPDAHRALSVAAPGADLRFGLGSRRLLEALGYTAHYALLKAVLAGRSVVFVGEKSLSSSSDAALSLAAVMPGLFEAAFCIEAAVSTDDARRASEREARTLASAVGQSTALAPLVSISHLDALQCVASQGKAVICGTTNSHVATMHLARLFPRATVVRLDDHATSQSHRKKNTFYPAAAPEVPGGKELPPLLDHRDVGKDLNLTGEALCRVTDHESMLLYELFGSIEDDAAELKHKLDSLSFVDVDDHVRHLLVRCVVALLRDVRGNDPRDEDAAQMLGERWGGSFLCAFFGTSAGMGWLATEATQWASVDPARLQELLNPSLLLQLQRSSRRVSQASSAAFENLSASAFDLYAGGQEFSSTDAIGATAASFKGASAAGIARIRESEVLAGTAASAREGALAARDGAMRALSGAAPALGWLRSSVADVWGRGGRADAAAQQGGRAGADAAAQQQGGRAAQEPTAAPTALPMAPPAAPPTTQPPALPPQTAAI
ncbi:transport protein Avl9-domain-containing protein [Pelagophyceae sp. CCMP2097]|nr:transport protein Avl9-domain-containing protein [Pelagophyceae sp. CCMP2097]